MLIQERKITIKTINWLTKQSRFCSWRNFAGQLVLQIDYSIRVKTFKRLSSDRSGIKKVSRSDLDEVFCQVRSHSIVLQYHSTQWRIQGGGGWGFKPPPPSEKKSSPYLGVSLGFGDILSEKQLIICLRLHEKAFGNQKFSRGGLL